MIISLLIWNTDDDAHHSYCVYYVKKQMKEMITSCYTHVHKQIMHTKTKFIDSFELSFSIHLTLFVCVHVCNKKLSFHCHHLNDSCECNVIKMGSNETHINVSLKCEQQRHKTVSTDHNFLTERTAKVESNQGLFAYQPNALALGQASSQMQLYQFYEIYLGGPVLVFVRIYRLK